MLIKFVSRHIRGFVVCLSFVNLSLIPFWKRYPYDYTDLVSYDYAFYFMLPGGVLLYAVYLLLRPWRNNSVIKLIALTGFLLFPLDGVLNGLQLTPDHIVSRYSEVIDASQVKIALVILLLIFLPLCIRFQHSVQSVCIAVLILMSPLVLFSAWLTWSRSDLDLDVHYTNDDLPQVSAKPATKAELILLDEADYQLIYDYRPESINLQGFEQLKSECMFFEKAYSPGRDTLNSVPSILMGKPVSSVRYNGLSLGVRTLSGDYTADWRAGDNLLNSLTDSGFNVAVTGSYHSYCDIDQKRYQSCSHRLVLMNDNLHFATLPFLGALYRHNTIVKRIVNRYKSDNPKQARTFLRHYRQEEFNNLRKRAESVLGSADFSFTHLSLPHPPSVVFDEPTASKNPYMAINKEGYYANLQIVDRFLRDKLRDFHNNSKGYTGYLLIVTSDHGLRLSSRKKWGNADISSFKKLAGRDNREESHVPLSLCYANVRSERKYAKPVNLIHLRGLVEKSLNGSIRSYDDIEKHFDAQDFSWDMVLGDAAIENLQDSSSANVSK